jgi:7-cyano-7-deazaguanine synthase
MGRQKAIVLLSGGLDSTTCLAYAQSLGFETYALSFFYQQRHRIELEKARQIAAFYNVTEHRIISLDFLSNIGGSSLTDLSLPIPELSEGIPSTYVPARNMIFMALATAWAEVLGALNIFIGVSAVDYSGYPDCRLEFIKAFETMARLGTKYGVEGATINFHTPLIHLSKKQTIELGLSLGVDYSQTLSCYQPTPQGQACGVCPSCLLRLKGFEEAGLIDPATSV